MKKAILAATTALAVLGAGASIANAKVFKWGFQTDTTSLDPHGHNVTFTVGFLGNIYESLVRRNADLKFEPGLATSWKIMEPTRWRFFLRKGVTFHDGNRFTAADVKYTWERTKHENSPLNGRVKGITDVVIVDDYTVDFITDGPNPILTAEWDTWFMMDKEWSEANGAKTVTNTAKRIESYAGRNANGTGAFVITERTQDVKTVLKPHAKWWDKPEHNLTKVIMTPVAQAATRVAALIAGDLDMAYPIPVQDIKRVNANKGTSVLVGPELRTIFLFMDTEREFMFGTKIKNPYLDIRVRKALYHAINIEAIKTRIMKGLSDPSALMISPKLYSRSGEFKRLAYDPAKAKQLLAEAGYPNGFTSRFDCPNDRYVNDEQICQAVTSMAAKVGIKLQLNAQPKAKYFAQIGRGREDFHLGLLGWTPGSFDSYNVLIWLHKSWKPEKDKAAGRFNVSRIDSAEIDALTAKVLTETDITRRNQYIYDAFKIATDNAYYMGIIYVFTQAGIYAHLM